MTNKILIIAALFLFACEQDNENIKTFDDTLQIENDQQKYNNIFVGKYCVIENFVETNANLAGEQTYIIDISKSKSDELLIYNLANIDTVRAVQNEVVLQSGGWLLYSTVGYSFLTFDI